LLAAECEVIHYLTVAATKGTEVINNDLLPKQNSLGAKLPQLLLQHCSKFHPKYRARRGSLENIMHTLLTHLPQITFAHCPDLHL
jgi:hypothetical protein